jgi:ubiquitin-protein ligase
MRFVTPILHANVNCYGRICHSVLGRQWTSDTKLSTVLGCVYG